jgi:flavin reductase (DIM6/NTAB) family NADH-FMN oxidoreductase RutF
MIQKTLLTPTAQALRSALGLFATGVTIVTTRASDGSMIGLTANSFNSVSLTPPLVLWSLGTKSGSLQAFLQAKHYAIHVLSVEQQNLAERFASKMAWVACRFCRAALRCLNARAAASIRKVIM